MPVRTPLPMLRTSERTAFKRCQFKWDLGTNRGLTPNTARPDARWFGTGIHLCKAEWYIPGRKRGRDMHETWDEFSQDTYATMSIRDDWEEEGKKKWVDANALAHAMIDGHLKEYGNDDSWEVIGVEHRFSVLIPHPLFPKRAITKYVGSIDLIIRDHDKPKNSQVWLDDTKTAAKIYTHHLTLLEQPASYVALGTWALREQGLIGPNERIRGIIFDFMRKDFPKDDRPKNERGEYTNKPIKKHYVEAIMAEETKRKIYHEDPEKSRKLLAKNGLDVLAGMAKDLGLTVLGDVSADQGTQMFLREEIEKTPAEMRRQIQRIGEEALVMQQIRAGKLPVLKTPQDDCSFCDFNMLCEADEAGGDVEDLIKLAYHKQDPYADHRDEAENSKTSVTNKIKTGVK